MLFTKNTPEHDFLQVLADDAVQVLLLVADSPLVLEDMARREHVVATLTAQLTCTDGQIPHLTRALVQCHISKSYSLHCCVCCVKEDSSSQSCGP